MSAAEEPLPVCRRCRGAGSVVTQDPAAYHVEDSSPRELPLVICPDCGGLGYVVGAKKRRA